MEKIINALIHGMFDERETFCVYSMLNTVIIMKMEQTI